jgi:hypothetical protein
MALKQQICQLKEKKMAISIDDKLKDILQNPKAVEIINRYTPGFEKNKQLKMVYGLTFRALSKFPQSGLSAENVAEIEKAFSEIE